MDLRSPPEDEIQHLASQLDKHTKPQLQSVCAINGLPKTGNKPDLKARIIKQLNSFRGIPMDEPYKTLRQSILGPGGSINGSSMTPAPSYSPASNGSRGYTYAQPALPYGLANGHRAQNAAIAGQGSAVGFSVPQPHSQPRPPPPITPGFSFKPSPFYQLKSRLGDMKTCEVMAQHRASVAMHVRAEDIQQCLSDPTLRILLFCAGGNSGIQDIAFPYQSELKVNGGDVKANLRGLKGKAGSTRPVDLTPSLRMRPHTYINAIEFTYALTNKESRLRSMRKNPPNSKQKFYLCVVLCKTFTAEDLVGQIQKKIRKDTVIADLTKKANDPDIVATSLNLSLKCPLSYMKLKTPCRGITCSHIQCFDALSYLQLQEQGPQWVCPICNKPAPFEQLATDEYVREIVAATSDSLDQVTIDPFGKWSIPGAKKPVKTTPQQASVIDDDDLVISYANNPAAGTSAPKTPASTVSLTGTPNSATPPAAPRTTNKRPAPEVIDLTLSDDDEPEVRAPKRHNVGPLGYGGLNY